MNIYLMFPLVIQKITKDKHMYFSFAPLGLLYIATVLRDNGHNVKIADRNELLIKNNYDFAAADKELLEKIAVFKPQIIGFSATTPLMYDVAHFSKEIKKLFPHIINIVGGPHTTAEPQETLKACPDIDLVAEGEGELTMLELVNNFPRTNIAGLWQRNGNGFSFAGKRELIKDLDTLLIPDRDLVNMEFYSKPNIGREFWGRYATMFSSRGCPHRCNYCAGALMSQGKIRYHSVGYVLEEMEMLIRRYRVDYIYFADDMFLADKNRAVSICEKILKKGLQKKVKWICQITAASATLDILKLIKKAGCVMAECGFESGSQAELERMNKRIKVEKYYEFSALAHKAGLRFGANIIKGYPEQIEEDFKLSIKLIQTIKPYCVQVNQFWPLPGTPSYKELLDKGYKIHWSDCTEFKQNFTKIPTERFKKLSKNFKLIKDALNKYNFRKYHIVHHPIFSMKKAFIGIKRCVRKHIFQS